MAKVPQMVIQAPSGPRNPQKPTVAARSAGAPAKVVRRTTNPHISPAAVALTYSSMWGGLQKVSRPTVMCHEMSHMRPSTMPAAQNRIPAMKGVFMAAPERRRRCPGPRA